MLPATAVPPVPALAPVPAVLPPPVVPAVPVVPPLLPPAPVVPAVPVEPEPPLEHAAMVSDAKARAMNPIPRGPTEPLECLMRRLGILPVAVAGTGDVGTGNRRSGAPRPVFTGQFFAAGQEMGLNRLTMEHPQTSTAPGVPFASFRLTLSEDARASLEAVRAAQETARLRARRQTMQARLWFAVILGAGALVVGSWPRLRHSLGGRASSIAAERTASPSLPPTAASSPPAERPMADPAGGPPPPPKQRMPPRPPRSPPRTTTNRVTGPRSEPTPWRVSPEACVRAFQANPTDATLALAIAQAEHAHGSHAEAAQWAKRALALDPSAAEAYVIVARAEKEGNRPEEAREAYRRYLELAPRGWHHSEARAALRSERSRGD